MELILLSALLFLSSVLMLVDLDSKSLWTDELLVLTQFKASFVSLLQTSWFNSPLRDLPYRIWYMLFGENIVALRALSVLFTLASIPFVYAIGRQLFGQKTALVGVFLTVTSPAVVMYSRAFHYYSLSLLTSVACLFFFFRFLEKPTKSRCALYVVSSVAVLYTYKIAALLIIAQNIYIFVVCHKQRQIVGYWLIGQLGLFSLYLPWLGRGITEILRSTSAAASQLPMPPLSRFLLNLGMSGYSLALGSTVYPWYYPITLVTLVVYLTVTVLVIRHLSQVKTGRLLLVVFLLMPLALISLGTTFNSGYVNRMGTLFFFLTPLFYLFVAHGITMFDKTSHSLFLLVLIIGLNVYSLRNYYTNSQFIVENFVVPWSNIAQSLKSRLTTGDILVHNQPLLSHYIHPLQQREIEANLEQLSAVIKESSPRRVWLVSRDTASRYFFQGRITSPRQGEVDCLVYLKNHYQLGETQGFLERSPRDKQYRTLILRRPAASHYVQVYLFTE